MTTSKQQYLNDRKDWTQQYNSLSNLIRAEKLLLKQLMRSFQDAQNRYYAGSHAEGTWTTWRDASKRKDKSIYDLAQHRKEANDMLDNLKTLKIEAGKRWLEDRK